MNEQRDIRSFLRNLAKLQPLTTRRHHGFERASASASSRSAKAENAAIAFSVFSRSAARSAATRKRRALEPFAF